MDKAVPQSEKMKAAGKRCVCVWGGGLGVQIRQHDKRVIDESLRERQTKKETQRKIRAKERRGEKGGHCEEQVQARRDRGINKPTFPLCIGFKRENSFIFISVPFQNHSIICNFLHFFTLDRRLIPFVSNRCIPLVHVMQACNYES